MEILTKPGRLFFAIGVAAFCIHQMLYADLRPVLIAKWPSWIPGLQLWAFIVNIALVIACLAIIFKKQSRLGALLPGWVLLLSFLFNHLPFQLTTNLHFIGGWTDSLKALALSGGALVVAGSLPKDTFDQRNNLYTLEKVFGKIIPAGKILFAITLIVFGTEHFIYPDFVATLVPSWIPAHVFWTYFAGIALIASGVAIIINIKARLASLLLGIMIFLWFLILHIPRGFADPYSGNGNELRSVFEALAFSGIAFVLAGRKEKALSRL